MLFRCRTAAAALTLISTLALSACGSSEVGHSPETVAAVKRAIEGLHYNIDVHGIPGQEGALLAELHGNLGESERFYVFVHRRVPLRINEVVRALGANNARQIEGGELTENYALLSRVGGHRGESQRQKEESESAIFAAEEALCEQATGEACGI